MKKTLVALAALAATGAFAQSSVTLSGHMDFAGATVSGTQLVAKGTTFATTTGTSSTSVIRFIATEKLTNGMTVTAQYNLDPRALSNDAATVTFVSAASTANTLTALTRDEVFIGLSGGFGNLRLGSPNSIGLGVHGVSSPLGTGIGSGYTGGGTAATMTNSIVQTRYNRSMRYDSPSVGGLTVSLQYAPGNDQAAVNSAATALLIPNARTATEVGVSYSAGPLNVAFANIAQAAQTNATGYYSSTTLANSVKTSTNILAANFKMGDTTLYAMVNDGEVLASTTAALTAKGSRVAVKHTMGAIDLMAQYSQQTNNSVKAKATGLRADYNLSKTAAVYVGYENWDTGATYSASTATTTGDRKITSIGLRKSF